MPKPIATWSPARDVWEVETTGLFCEHSDVFSAIWPTSGMTRNGTAYALPTSAHPTDDSGSSSLLPTPRVQAGGGAGPTPGRISTERGMDLSTATSLLPTPTAHDAKATAPSQLERNSPMLSELPTLLPTPPATRGGSATETVELLLPTPSVADALGGHRSTSGSRSDELLLPGLVLTLLPTPTTDPDTGNGHARNLCTETKLLASGGLTAQLSDDGNTPSDE